MPAGPRLKSSVGERSAGNPSGSGVDRGHVLIIDDEESIIEVLREVLTEEGWRVTGRPTPPSLDDIRDLAPDVILLDLLFNGNHDGLTLLESIHLDLSTAAIPVIVCTAVPNPYLLVPISEEQPTIKILVKPFDIDEIISTISALRK